MTPLLIIIVIVVLIGAYFLSVYNFLATVKVRIGASIQEIGNQLKRQADLIPNLEASAKGYLKHEKEIFKMLVDARRAVAAEYGQSAGHTSWPGRTSSSCGS